MNEREIAVQALSSALALRHVRSLHERVRAGELRARDLVRLRAEERDEDEAVERRLLAGLDRVESLAARAASRRASAERLHAALLDLELGPRAIDDIVRQLIALHDRQQSLRAQLASLKRAADAAAARAVRRDLAAIQRETGMAPVACERALCAIRAAQQRIADGQAGADRVEPAAGGRHRAALPQSRPRAVRPDPGGQPGAHARGGAFRPPARLPLLDLCEVVDPQGHHLRHRRPCPHHPHPGRRGRGARQDQGHGAPPDARARARAHRGGAGGTPAHAHRAGRAPAAPRRRGGTRSDLARDGRG